MPIDVETRNSLLQKTLGRFAMACVLISSAWVPESAWSQTGDPSAPSHCKADERVVFSCTFRHGKTASLCASKDLSATTGTLQYRYGIVGKRIELVYPRFEEVIPGFEHPTRRFTWFYNSVGPGDPFGSARGSSLWSTSNLPAGARVSMRLIFNPIEDNASIDFLVEVSAGRGFPTQEARLVILEIVGRGREMANHRCLRDKTFEDMYSLKAVFQK